MAPKTLGSTVLQHEKGIEKTINTEGQRKRPEISRQEVTDGQRMKKGTRAGKSGKDVDKCSTWAGTVTQCHLQEAALDADAKSRLTGQSGAQVLN